MHSCSNRYQCIIFTSSYHKYLFTVHIYISYIISISYLLHLGKRVTADRILKNMNMNNLFSLHFWIFSKLDLNEHHQVTLNLVLGLFIIPNRFYSEETVWPTWCWCHWKRVLVVFHRLKLNAYYLEEYFFLREFRNGSRTPLVKKESIRVGEYGKGKIYTFDFFYVLINRCSCFLNMTWNFRVMCDVTWKISCFVLWLRYFL